MKDLQKALFLPFVSLLLSMAGALFFWKMALDVVDQRAEQRFRKEAVEMIGRIRQRLDVYVSVLNGARAFVTASQVVHGDEWRTYVQSIALSETYPGILTIRYILRVTPEDLRGFVSAIHREKKIFRELGYPDLKIKAEPGDRDHYVVLYCEPLAGNQWMFGLDLSTRENIRDLYDAARDARRFMASDILDVREGWRLSAPGFLITAPLFHANTQDHLGFVDMVLKSDELFSNLTVSEHEQPISDFEIYDGLSAVPDKIIFQSHATGSEKHRPRYVMSEVIDVAGRPWTLYFSSRPSFKLDPLQESLPTVVLYAGSAISLLIFGLVYSLSLSRHRAESLAEEMTVEMKQAMQVKTEFTSTVSHELRTPLAAIRESISMMEDGTVGEVNEEQKDMLQTASRNVSRLSRLIDAVLLHQSMENKPVELQNCEVAINDFVKDVLKTYKPMAARKNLQLKFDADASLGNACVFADTDRLTQVLLNYLDNAFKFSDEGGIQVATRRHGSTVRVIVEDRGVGIRPEDLTRLFKDFTQLKAIGGRKTGGTGLGLSISKKIIEAHGGAVGVESFPGTGSKFFFELPLVKSPERTAP